MQPQEVDYGTPRSESETQVTLEMSVRASTAYDKGQQKIPDLLKAYFMSDTLTCKSEQQ